MANGIQTRVRPEVLVISGLLAVGGIALIIMGMTQGVDEFGALSFSSIGSDLGSVPEGSGVLSTTLGTSVTLVLPTYVYRGPGRSIAGYARLAQVFPGIPGEVTVYGSGLAISLAPPSANLMQHFFVPIPTVQPVGCPNAGVATQDVCMLPWPGTNVTGICGIPPQPGPANLYLEIYDFGGSFAPPTCVERTLMVQFRWPGKVNFV